VSAVSTPASRAAGRGSKPAVRSSDRSVSGKHASSPSSQDEFESRRSLAVLAQLAEAQVLGTWRSGFESPGRYPWKVNQTGALGSVASGCAGETVPFESVAFCSWRMNQPGGWPRPETGWARKRWDSISPSSAIPCLFTPGGGVVLESEPARRGDRFEGGSAFARRGSFPPLSAPEDARPAPQWGLNPRDG
jgi:hypothetical protein